jgi:hypothetical protein
LTLLSLNIFQKSVGDESHLSVVVTNCNMCYSNVFVVYILQVLKKGDRNVLLRYGYLVEKLVLLRFKVAEGRLTFADDVKEELSICSRMIGMQMNWNSQLRIQVNYCGYSEDKTKLTRTDSSLHLVHITLNAVEKRLLL